MPLDIQRATIAAPTTANLLIKNYCPRTGFRYLDFWGHALSYKISSSQILVDTDRDGLANVQETDPSLGINYLRADTNEDGYSDLLVYLAGFTLEAQSHLRFCAAADQDSDFDGLTDCEEQTITHTDPFKFDTDQDGIPDGIEIRKSMNPLDGADKDQNPSGDGITNISKVKQNLPIYETVTDDVKAFAFQYAITSTEVNGQTCFNLRINNIPLVEVTSGNAVRLMFMERQTSSDRYALKSKDYLIESLTRGIDAYEVQYEQGADAEWSVYQ